MNGSYLELRDSGLDFRDHLDSEPIHNSDQLLLLVDRAWIYVRYEVKDFRKREVVLIGADCMWRLNRSTMRFRWPDRE